MRPLPLQRPLTSSGLPPWPERTPPAAWVPTGGCSGALVPAQVHRLCRPDRAPPATLRLPAATTRTQPVALPCTSHAPPMHLPCTAGAHGLPQARARHDVGGRLLWLLRLGRPLLRGPPRPAPHISYTPLAAPHKATSPGHTPLLRPLR
eukprot:scaffold27214_cov63-Phaeocystis_antarctica.AAC.4